MVLLRVRPHTVLAVACLALAGTAARALVVDVVGGKVNSGFPNPWTGKGNAFRVDSSTTLLQQEFRLDFQGQKTVAFCVYENGPEYGTYTRIGETEASLTGTGEAWYSSGPMAVSLTAGRHYILAWSAPGDTRYFFNVSEPQPVSFGSYVHGFATGVYPMGASIISASHDSAAYYQRVTTGAIPEPCSLALLAGAAPALLLVRRKRI